MTEITATVLTLNEEENIGDCLKTLQWCDEIIVVDGYSEDQTVEIAEDYADKIFQLESEGYSEPFRQFAKEEASGDWVLMIDADERVPEKLADKLRDLSKKDNLDVVEAPRKNYILGEWMRYAGWWPDYTPCMYRPEAVNIVDRIHQFLEIKEESNVKKISENEEKAIHHFSYTGIEDRIERINKYTTIEAKQYENPFAIYKLVLSPAKIFLSKLITRGGYKAGIRGLIISFLDALYPLIQELKKWQMKEIGDEDKIKQLYSQESSRVVGDTKE